MDSQENWVPKVHPLTRESQPEDPMELMAQVVVGDPDVMLECILQDFIWLGWSSEQLLSLFHDPGYPMLCELREFYGDAEIEQRVDSLVARCGNLRFHATVVETEEEEHDHSPELLQITLNPALAEQTLAESSKERPYGSGL